MGQQGCGGGAGASTLRVSRTRGRCTVVGAGPMGSGHRVTMKSRLLAALLSVSACALFASDSGAAKPKVTPEAALELLVAGNRRFAAGRPMFPDQSPARRRELAQGQKPFAIVLTCADSRVAPELYFDQGLGNLFVLRNAGNLLNDHTIGSIEYAVEHLKVGLIVIVGHEKCGAVAAAVAGGHAPGHIGSIVASIQPAVQASADEGGDKVENAVRANARLVAAALEASDPILNEAVKAGRLKIVPARYDLETGKVELLGAKIAAPAKPETVAAHAEPAKAGH
jgi:carbonic anhydrase